MSHGKDFENSLCESLEEWVGDRGYVWIRRQTRGMRRGTFTMNQECDVFVDSEESEYYTCFEAKSRNGESRPGFYFSSDLDIEQIESGIEYAEQSGRDYLIAVEVRNYDGSDYQKTAWLLAPELFVRTHEKGEKKVSWDQIDQYGYCIGHDREYTITHEAVESALVHERKQ